MAQGDYTEYGGYAGDNRTRPDGKPCRLSNAEMARDMRREGITGETPPSILGSAVNKNRGPVGLGDALKH